MSEKFSLNWKDFKLNAVNSFSKLRNSSEFNDVTLVGDDHKTISAHKVILSSCSEYFKSILIKHVHSNPLLCLDGVNSEDIENVLDFIYTGELHMFQEDLDRFLHIAQKLKIDGIIGIKDDLASTVVKDETQNFEEDILDENTRNSMEPKIEGDEGAIVNNFTVKSFTKAELPNIEELDSKIKEYIQKIDIGATCLICGRVFKHVCHAKEHIEVSHIDGLKFPCNLCDKVLKNRRAIRDHRRFCKPK